MENINMLLKIQENHIRVIKCENYLKDTSYTNLLRKLKTSFERKKEIYINKDRELEMIKKEFNVKNNEIDQINSEINKAEYDLYNNAGNNLELIEKLQNKISQLKNLTEQLDFESMRLIEKEEEVNKEKEQLKLELIELKNNFYSEKNKVEKSVKESKEELKALKVENEKLKKMIPNELMEVYNKIVSSEEITIAELQHGVCTGCKMRVSSLTMDSLRKDKEIVYCDNCGRILYSNNSVNLKIRK